MLRTFLLLALGASIAAGEDIPRLVKSQLIVGGEPFVMLAGELHNSSASSVEYMRPIWDKLQAMHLNTVIGTVSWELLEPAEGTFDFTLVDSQIAEARRRNLRLVLIWFGSWKNAASSYVPLWVKKDPKRFPLMSTRNGSPSFMGLPQESLSPFGAESAAADARAFRALMRHIRETDPDHTVIMMQVENETGLLGDSRDRSPLAEAAWAAPVPVPLLKAGQKGTWREVFGDGPRAEEIFMAWHLGRYVNKVAGAGKAELPLPMYVNAWLGPQPGQDLPGQYPSGGPVARVMDVWRAAAPNIDLFAPDIYIDDFRGVCESYTRSGNPLFIPEARALVANLFWALGRHNALGYSPFGIEDLKQDDPLAEAYRILGGMSSLLARSEKTAVAPHETKISFAGYSMNVRKPGHALIVSLAPDELLFIGSGLEVTLEGAARIGTIDEGRFENGRWIAGRRLNGDESAHGNLITLGERSLDIRRVKLYQRSTANPLSRDASSRSVPPV